MFQRMGKLNVLTGLSETASRIPIQSHIVCLTRNTESEKDIGGEDDPKKFDEIIITSIISHLKTII